MNNVMEKKKALITSSKASIVQDTALSCLGSFFAFLLVRWLSEPIYGFTLHFFIYVGCALAFTLLGQLLSGSFRNLSPGVSYWAGDRLLLTILIKLVISPFTIDTMMSIFAFSFMPPNSLSSMLRYAL